MCLVDELLELIGRSVSARGGKEARHLVAEARIVRVLHDGHQLHGVIALTLHCRQNVLAEVVVCRYLAFRR